MGGMITSQRKLVSNPRTLVFLISAAAQWKLSWSHCKSYQVSRRDVRPPDQGELGHYRPGRSTPTFEPLNNAGPGIEPGACQTHVTCYSTAPMADLNDLCWPDFSITGLKCSGLFAHIFQCGAPCGKPQPSYVFGSPRHFS